MGDVGLTDTALFYTTLLYTARLFFPLPIEASSKPAASLPLVKSVSPVQLDSQLASHQPASQSVQLDSQLDSHHPAISQVS